MKKKRPDPFDQAKQEIREGLNPGAESDTGKARRLRKALKGAMTPLDEVLKDVADEPTVICTDPKKKFTRLREAARLNHELTRYIRILEKHGHDSKQDKAFIRKVIRRGDGALFEECVFAKQVREALAAIKSESGILRPKNKRRLV